MRARRRLHAGVLPEDVSSLGGAAHAQRQAAAEALRAAKGKLVGRQRRERLRRRLRLFKSHVRAGAALLQLVILGNLGGAGVHVCLKHVQLAVHLAASLGHRGLEVLQRVHCRGVPVLQRQQACGSLRRGMRQGWRSARKQDAREGAPC